jgi:hypothetical protein
VIGHLQQLAAGGFPLAQAFWRDAIVYGSLLNLILTGLAFAVLAADGPAWLAVAVFFSAVPYNALAALGVWRSAARYGGPPANATLARIAVTAWAVAASLV